MRNIAFLILMLAAFGLTSGRRMFRKCTFCRYFFATGNSPYELLWILSDEISSHLSEDQRITLFLDEEDLTKAELVFETYCERTCTKDPASAFTETVAEADNSASSAVNGAFKEPYNGSVMPFNGPYNRFSSQTPKIRTLFNGVKITSSPKRAKSAGEYSERNPESEAPFVTSENMSEGLAIGASVQNPGGPPRMSAANSGTNGKENNVVELRGASSKAFGKHPGGYRIPDTSVSIGSSVKYTGSAEARTRTFSDVSDEHMNRFERLSSAGMKYPNAARISGSDEANKVVIQLPIQD